MFRLYLVRHGETEAAAEGIFSGDLDPPLTERGRAQAERVGGLTVGLGLTALYASPKLRARATVEPTERATGLTATLDDGLRELGYGAWETRREADVRATEPEAYGAWSADPAAVGPPAGENAYAVAARAMPVIARIRAAHPSDDAVLVVSHKATIRVITCALLGIPVARFRDRLVCPPASVTTFAFGERGPILVGIGDVQHLEE
jgi:broad specificity phosphatase PhoE